MNRDEAINALTERMIEEFGRVDFYTIRAALRDFADAIAPPLRMPPPENPPGMYYTTVPAESMRGGTVVIHPQAEPPAPLIFGPRPHPQQP